MKITIPRILVPGPIEVGNGNTFCRLYGDSCKPSMKVVVYYYRDILFVGAVYTYTIMIIVTWYKRLERDFTFHLIHH